MSNFREQLQQGTLKFVDVLAHIESLFDTHAVSFQNGNLINTAEQNQGSAKVLYFAQINCWTKEDTLSLFAEHYQAVLDTPEGTDHQNIRQFMENGWEGVLFEGAVLKEK